MNRTQTRIVSVPCTVLLLALAGCATRTPYLDSQFGQSVRLLNAQQTINPQAALNTDPVKGLDGKAAASGYANYEKSYAKPEPQASAFTIGVGGR
ncbi:MAG: pilus assembly protein [Burkholderiaceae bacterium]|nr:pilus assembly protein [Burkholderiaceae bacterium]